MRKIVFSAATAAILAFATAGWAQQNALNPTTAGCSTLPDDGGFCLSGQYTLPPTASAAEEGGGNGLTTFAKEIFGEGATDVLITPASGTDVRLSANFSGTFGAPAENRRVDAEKVVEITFSLQDGVLFGESVRPLAFSENGTVMQSKITQADSTGGQRGDSSVTYVIKAEQRLEAASSVFTFTVPKLMNATILGGQAAGDRASLVKLTVTAQPRSGQFDTGDKFPTFPAAGTTDNNVNVRSLVRSVLAYPLTVTPGEEQTVNINIDDRAAFVVPNTNVETVTGSALGASGRSALKIATLDINQVTGANQASGTGSFTATSGDVVSITARGPFGTGDIIFLSRDTVLSTTGASSTRDVTLTLSGTTATSTIPLADVGDGNLRTLYLVPAAGRSLSRGLYRATFEANFSQGSMRDTTARAAGVRLEYSNLSVQGYAYAIPNPGAADIGNLRLRCESSGNCAVFLDCQDQSGTTIGGFPELTIMPKATMVLNTKSTTTGTSLARALGVETWPGRLSCEILSNANIGVQILTRSDGTLVNNTYVSGSEPAASTP